MFQALTNAAGDEGLQDVMEAHDDLISAVVKLLTLLSEVLSCKVSTAMIN